MPDELRERVTRVEEIVKMLVDEVGEIEEELNGPPRETSIRGRLHKIETAGATEKAASNAVAALRAEREALSATKERRRFAYAALVATVLNVAIAVHPWTW